MTPFQDSGLKRGKFESDTTSCSTMHNKTESETRRVLDRETRQRNESEKRDSGNSGIFTPVHYFASYPCSTVHNNYYNPREQV